MAVLLVRHIYEPRVELIYPSLSLPLTAAGLLHLGDELVSVNGVSLRGLTHVKVVQQLCSAGHNVVLMVRPNQLLEGGLI